MNSSAFSKSKLPTLLSIVVPVYNEAGNISPLVDAIKKSVDNLSITYEVIFIDDGSQDGTWDAVTKVSRADPRVKGLSLSRNFGHQHAILKLAKGEYSLTMDGDLQHPPSLLPAMLREWQNGFKIVHTRRISHRKQPAFKRLTSKAFYWVFSLLTQVVIPEGSSDFRLLDRQVLDNITKFNDVEFFIRGVVNWIGFPATVLTYQENERFSDKSKYTFTRMFRLAVSGVVAFTSLPLKIGIWLGLFTSVLAFLEIIYIFIKFVQGVTVPGWASIVGIVSFLFGILFMILGCIGLYIANIHENLKNRPRFVIQQKVNLS